MYKEGDIVYTTFGEGVIMGIDIPQSRAWRYIIKITRQIKDHLLIDENKLMGFDPKDVMSIDEIRNNVLVLAAIKRGGRILTGKRHSDCINQAIASGWYKPITQEEQGFVDSCGNYYNRKYALNYAKIIGQVKEDHKGPLFSEDLW